MVQKDLIIIQTFLKMNNIKKLWNYRSKINVIYRYKKIYKITLSVPLDSFSNLVTRKTDNSHFSYT